MATWKHKTYTYRYDKHDTDLNITAAHDTALDVIANDGGVPLFESLQPHGKYMIVIITYKQNLG